MRLSSCTHLRQANANSCSRAATLKMVCDVGASADCDHSRTFLYVLCFFVFKSSLSCFSCSAERCNSVLLWSSRTVLWTTTLHVTWLHNDCGIYISGWTDPLISRPCLKMALTVLLIVKTNRADDRKLEGKNSWWIRTSNITVTQFRLQAIRTPHFSLSN